MVWKVDLKNISVFSNKSIENMFPDIKYNDVVVIIMYLFYLPIKVGDHTICGPTPVAMYSAE